MKYTPPLQSATLLKRYKRFLADLQLQTGQTFTAHCANTGKMTGCAEPNFNAFYSTSHNKKRKYPHSLELTQNAQSQLICVNTAIANKIVKEAIENKVITELDGYQELQSEVVYGDENSRIDFLLSSNHKPKCYVEVKSVTLLSETAPHTGQGYFPDTQTVRGQKHIRELVKMIAQGHRAVLIFVILHEGINTVSPAQHIDKNYTLLLQNAIKQGVEVLTYTTYLSTEEVKITHKANFKV